MDQVCEAWSAVWKPVLLPVRLPLATVRAIMEAWGQNPQGSQSREQLILPQRPDSVLQST